MASTKSLAEAVSVARLPRQQEDDQAGYIVSAAMNELWNSYDWRETLAYFPPFYLQPLEQDYGSPFTVLPTNFRGLRKAYLVQTFSNPPSHTELEVMRDVRLTGAMGLPSSIGYEPTNNCIRVFPRVPSNVGATEFLIDGTYKKRCPIYASAELAGNTIQFDDEYFRVLVVGIKWAAYIFSDDQRADRKFQEFHELIDEMAAREGLDLGDPVIAPAEPLISTGTFHGPLLYI